MISNDAETLIAYGTRADLAAALRNLAAVADLSADAFSHQADVMRIVLDLVRSGQPAGAAEVLERLLEAIDGHGVARQLPAIDLAVLLPAGRA